MELLKRWVGITDLIPKSHPVDTSLVAKSSLWDEVLLIYSLFIYDLLCLSIFPLFPGLSWGWSLHWEPLWPMGLWPEGWDQFWDSHHLSLLLKYLTISKSLFSRGTVGASEPLISRTKMMLMSSKPLSYFSFQLGISLSTEQFWACLQHSALKWAQIDRAQCRDGVPALPSTVEGLELSRTCVRNSYKRLFRHPEVDQMPLAVPAVPVISLKVSILIALNNQYFTDEGI